MYYGQILKMALSEPKIGPSPSTWPLPTNPPATDARTAKRTGDRIDGHFEMFRDRDGRMVFIGEDGQYIKK